jgi:MFS family permease
MYRFDLVEQLKLRTVEPPRQSQLARVPPTVWRLGFTSLLTDVSAEMVNSLLPAYLVLYLHAGPLTYGVIDGVYHGMAVSLLGILGGVFSDRWRRYREVAALGYGLSALCKLGLLAAQGAMGWIGAVVALDRAGKGIRTAPRDALLSLSSEGSTVTTSFAVHRALDAGGTLIGPLLAFAILARFPHGYDAVWLTSFVFAVIGVAVLWLFVQNPSVTKEVQAHVRVPWRELAKFNPRFRRVLLAAGSLALFSISDGFVYLLLQGKSGAAAHYFPLYFVVTSVCYMLLSVPVGLVAGRIGRRTVLLSAYAILLLLYGLIFLGLVGGQAVPMVALVLFGLFYAGSEGVLMAVASETIPAAQRTSGLAVLNAGIGLGRLAGSVMFGWTWHSAGAQGALQLFGVGLIAAIVASAWLLPAPAER